MPNKFHTHLLKTVVVSKERGPIKCSSCNKIKNDIHQYFLWKILQYPTCYFILFKNQCSCGINVTWTKLDLIFMYFEIFTICNECSNCCLIVRYSTHYLPFICIPKDTWRIPITLFIAFIEFNNPYNCNFIHSINLVLIILTSSLWFFFAILTHRHG